MTDFFTSFGIYFILVGIGTLNERGVWLMSEKVFKSDIC